MAIKSDNQRGNQFHDEKTGQFTSADSASSSTSPETPTLKMKLKIKSDVNIQDIINDLNECSSVEPLKTAKDIEDNIDRFFSKIVTEKIDSLYGNTSGCASYQFHPKSNPRMILEIFPNVLGKYRYKDNHATIVSSTDFFKLQGSGKYTPIYRGISSSGEKARNIVNNYGTVDLNNFDYYCPNGGNCFGSNIYTTVRHNYASSYSGYNGTLIHGLLDEGSSRSMQYYEVRRIASQLNASVIQDKVGERLQKNGLEQSRAQRIAKSFAQACTNDPGVVAILLGLDYYISDGHQRNLFNLSKWIIKEV